MAYLVSDGKVRAGRELAGKWNQLRWFLHDTQKFHGTYLEGATVFKGGKRAQTDYGGLDVNTPKLI